MSAVTDLITAKKQDLKYLKMDLKAVRKSKNPMKIDKLENQIAEEERFIKRFAVSKMAPVRVGSIVVNQKTYDAFIKKLKAFEYTTKLTDKNLHIYYHRGTNRGELILNDLTDYFLAGTTFPNGNIPVDQIAGE